MSSLDVIVVQTHQPSQALPDKTCWSAVSSRLGKLSVCPFDCVSALQRCQQGTADCIAQLEVQACGLISRSDAQKVASSLFLPIEDVGG